PEWSPFVPRQGQSNSSLPAKLYRELGTDKEISVWWRHFKKFSDFREEEKRTSNYVRNLICYRQDFLERVSAAGEPKILCIDLEMFTRGGLPRPDRDPIIAFGAGMLNKRWRESCWTRSGNGWVHDPSKNDIVIRIERKDEESLLRGLISVVKKEDPDVIATFFGTDFDLPYFYQRCAKYDIDPSTLNRFKIDDARKKDVERGYFISQKDGELLLTACGKSMGIGRVHDDIYLNSVKRDTNIKAKNKRMKTVADYYGLEGIYDLPSEKKEDMGNVSDEEMHVYLESDIRSTCFLEDKYLPLTFAISEMLEWPLSMAIARTPGALSDLYCAREAFKKECISVKTNGQKFPEVYQLIEAAGGKFEGAYNFAREYSYSKEVQKLDVGSMYPSIMIQFNLSPDTTTLEAIVPISDRRYLGESDDVQRALGFVDHPEYRVYSVPDGKIARHF